MTADLSKQGIVAKGYSVDLSDASAVKAAVAAVQHDQGPIEIIFWNPYGPVAGFLEATPEQVISGYNTTVTGMAALPDLQCLGRHS